MGIGVASYGSVPFGSTSGVVDEGFYVTHWSPRLLESVSRLQTVEFDVYYYDESTRESSVTEVQVKLVFNDGQSEVAWTDRSGFTQLYVRGSDRTRISGGQHLLLRRTRGWPNPGFQIHVVGKNLAGHVIRAQSL